MTKPTIVILGLPRSTVRRVIEKTSGRAKLEFVNTNGKRPSLPRGDHCIVYVARCRHSWTDLVFRSFARDRIRMVPRGSEGIIVRTIEDILTKP